MVELDLVAFSNKEAAAKQSSKVMGSGTRSGKVMGGGKQSSKVRGRTTYINFECINFLGALQGAQA